MRWFIPLLIFMIALATGCNQPEPAKNGESQEPVKKQMPETMPSDFAFAIHYGLGGGKNAVNTFNHTVTKDLIVAGTATIEDFSFTEKEMKNIYRKMREANVMADQNLDYEKNCARNPYSTYSMKVRINGENQAFHWSNRNCGMTEDGKKLVDVISFINTMVVVKDSYQQLPEPRGGYE